MITSRNYIKLDEKVNSITSIPPRAKILHGEIFALSQADGFCFASNKFFARRLNLSIQSVSRLIGVTHNKTKTMKRQLSRRKTKAN